MELSADVQPFLEESTSVSPATRSKLLGILHNPNDKTHLMVELAVTMDAAMPFVRATHELEGDGPLALSCYDAISAMNAAARQAHYLNLLQLLLLLLLRMAQIENDLLQYARTCVQTGISYYFEELTTNMKELLELSRQHDYYLHQS